VGPTSAVHDHAVDAPTLEPDDISVLILALMRIEGKVNYVINLLENDGQDEA
jgi:hypothetical protein